MTGRWTMIALSAYFIWQVGQVVRGVFEQAAGVLF